MLIAEEDLWRDVTAECDDPCPASAPQAAIPVAQLTADTVAGRRSVREFSADAIEPEQLGAALRAAWAADLWVLAPDADFGVAVAAMRVRARDSGVYLVDGDRLGRPCVAYPDLSTLVGCYADAAAMFLIYGTPGTGPHAYAGLLARAGAFGYTLWLAGRAEGLEGCVYGGAMAKVTTMLTTTTGRPLRHLFTVTLGRPPR